MNSLITSMTYSLLLIFIIGCTAHQSSLTDNPSPPTKPDWIIESDKVAKEYTHSFAKLYPEMGSGLGLHEYDALGHIPSEELEDKGLALIKNWKKRLTRLAANTESNDLKADYLILLDKVDKQLKSYYIDEKFGAIPVPELSLTIYRYLFQLINIQSPAHRKKAAVSRFKYYMLEKGKLNLIAAYVNEIKRYERKYNNKKKFYPFRGKVEKYLKDSPIYIKGIEALLKQSGRNDWHKEYKLFVKEIKRYDSLLRSKILPKCRKKPNYPKEVYELQLASYGVKTEPTNLIKIGKEDYKKLYKNFKQLAMRLAKKFSLKNTSPKSVIAYLKKEVVLQSEEVKALYQSSSNRLEQIIKANEIVSLPKKPLTIRMAGDAESKANPVPHLKPPPLLNNNGVMPEFVVPTSSDGKLPFDDFSYKSAATILTAHEGRPGHDLQFSRMLESPISIIRASYAMNSVNVEGWALYAEDLVFPYISEEEQLIAMQTRLWRIARYFLDPMVQLDKADEKDVQQIFHQELGVSKVMAHLEYQRYAFRSPGQATSYYEGYVNILNLRKLLEKGYGKLKSKCFHDTLLSFGLLPHKQIELFKEHFKKCSEPL